MRDPKRFAFFKNALAVWTGIYGLAIAISPDAGSPRFVVALTGHREVVQVLGMLMIGFAIGGVFVKYSPIRLWIMIIPFACFSALAFWGLFSVPDPVPSAIIIITMPLALTAAYVWERINHG